ncbi:MAG: peptidoglycan DD-metalloendopeptidase family protein [Clostridia bacterium]|nr:peptidoglycan DD-metalloendopeptidase family protein [Clostridia bacterium]
MGLETEEKSQSNSALPTGNAKSRRQTYTSLYRAFRNSGLTKLDSAFNALYICQSNRLCRIKLDTESVGEGFFSHPAGWYKASCEKVRRASRTKTLKALELIAKLIAPFTSSVERLTKKVDFFGDSSTVTLQRAVKSFKKAFPATAVVVLTVALFGAVYADSEKTTVIEVNVDGVKVAEVLSSDTVEEALERVNSKISSITGQAFSFPHELSFASRKVKKADCLDINEMSELLLTYTDHLVTEAYGLYIDNSLVAVLSNRNDITSALETLCSEHMEITGEEENIANNIEIKYQEYSAKDVIDKETLLSMFEVSAPQEEEVKAPVEALLSARSVPATLTIDAEALAIEEKIADAVSSLEGAEEDAIELDFAVYYEEIVRESVPYTTRYIYDDTYYENQEVVQKSGRDGLANNTYKVKYVNGEEESRELVEQSFIRLPRESVVKVGTKKLPENMPDRENGGKYMINPVPTATVSDHFGQRILNGRSDYHEGLDLAAWVGTSIYASASGEIIYAGYNPTYGYVVKILHDDGLISVFAHCSKLLVDVGDYVSQAEEIALVGSTGYSFGYHCHFEVIKDGVKVDPENYIYSLD